MSDNTMNRSEFERVQARLKGAPLTLTDDDISALRTHGGPAVAATAYEARRLAALAVLEAPAQTTTIQKSADTTAPPRSSSKSAKWIDELGDIMINMVKMAIAPLKTQIATLQTQNRQHDVRSAKRQTKAGATASIRVPLPRRVRQFVRERIARLETQIAFAFPRLHEIVTSGSQDGCRHAGCTGGCLTAERHDPG
jgi:hypothetical protein